MYASPARSRTAEGATITPSRAVADSGAAIAPGGMGAQARDIPSSPIRRSIQGASHLRCSQTGPISSPNATSLPPGRPHWAQITSVPLPVWVWKFASLPSAPSQTLFFNVLSGTVGGTVEPLPSAASATVRTNCAAKPFAGLDFGMGADDADGADGSAPGFSGIERVWIAVMLMVRVRARPSRPKPISYAVFCLKKKRRPNCPRTALRTSGQDLDIAHPSRDTDASTNS